MPLAKKLKGEGSPKKLCEVSSHTSVCNVIDQAVLCESTCNFPFAICAFSACGVCSVVSSLCVDEEYSATPCVVDNLSRIVSDVVPVNVNGLCNVQFLSGKLSFVRKLLLGDSGACHSVCSTQFTSTHNMPVRKLRAHSLKVASGDAIRAVGLSSILLCFANFCFKTLSSFWISYTPSLFWDRIFLYILDFLFRFPLVHARSV